MEPSRKSRAIELSYNRYSLCRWKKLQHRRASIRRRQGRRTRTTGRTSRTNSCRENSRRSPTLAHPCCQKNSSIGWVEISISGDWGCMGGWTKKCRAWWGKRTSFRLNVRLFEIKTHQTAASVVVVYSHYYWRSLVQIPVGANILWDSIDCTLHRAY